MQKYISFIGYFGFYTKFSNLVQWATLHYNLFKYFFKTSTKIRGVSRSILFNLMQKPIDVLWKFWVNQPHLHSGPTWGFVLQPYFYLLFYPWLFFLLVVVPTKPLSPRDWTHWSIFGTWYHALFFLSKTEVLQNLH